MDRIDKLTNSVRLNTLSFTVVMMLGIMLLKHNSFWIMHILMIIVFVFIIYLSAAMDLFEILKDDERIGYNDNPEN